MRKLPASILIICLVHTVAAQTPMPETKAATAPMVRLNAEQPEVHLNLCELKIAPAFGVLARTDRMVELFSHRSNSLKNWPMTAAIWKDVRTYAQTPTSTGQSQTRSSSVGRRVLGAALTAAGVGLMVGSRTWYKHRREERVDQAIRTGQMASLGEEDIAGDAAFTGMFIGGTFTAMAGVVLLIKK